MTEREQKIDELKKACKCLFLKVSAVVAQDVKDKAYSVIRELEACTEMEDTDETMGT